MWKCLGSEFCLNQSSLVYYISIYTYTMGGRVNVLVVQCHFGRGMGGGEALNVLQIPRGLTVNLLLELHSSAVHQVPLEGTFFFYWMFLRTLQVRHIRLLRLRTTWKEYLHQTPDNSCGHTVEPGPKRFVLEGPCRNWRAPGSGESGVMTLDLRVLKRVAPFWYTLPTWIVWEFRGSPRGTLKSKGCFPNDETGGNPIGEKAIRTGSISPPDQSCQGPTGSNGPNPASLQARDKSPSCHRKGPAPTT